MPFLVYLFNEFQYILSFNHWNQRILDSRARVALGIKKAFIRVTQIITVLKPVVWTVDKKEVKNFTWPGGKPFGYLRAWLRSCTQDYQEEIQLAFREGIEVGACGFQFQHSNQSATLPPYEATRHFKQSFFYFFFLSDAFMDVAVVGS